MKDTNSFSSTFLLSLALSALAAAIIFGLWIIGLFAPLQNLVLFYPPNAPVTAFLSSNLLALPILLVVGLAVGFLTERFGSRRIWLYLLISVFTLFVFNLIAGRFFEIDFLFVPSLFTVISAFIITQIRRLWEIDKELSTAVERLSLANHILEGKAAEGRVNSGLQLLRTVLPLDEIIIFQLAENGDLTPVGRAQDGAKKDAGARQNEWREGVGLCDEALKSNEVIVQKVEGKKGVARVAIPLIHEEKKVGALLVRFREGFEEADRNLLKAFSEQLARNFHRQEIRNKPWDKRHLTLVSTNESKHRLEGFRLVSGLLTEQQFGSLSFSEMTDGHAISYLDGTLAYVNRQMLRSSRITVDRVRQIDLFGLLERFKGGVFDDPGIALRRVLQTGDKYHRELNFPERNQTLDLQISLVKGEADIQAVHDTQTLNKPLCFVITVRDITALKENERLRSDMVSLMSHELRTPITSINGFAELLMMDENIPAESREFLGIISSEAQRLSKMINTFLAVSKLEQGDKREVIKIPVRLDSLAHEVMSSLQPDARKKRIRLVEQANSHLPPVAADKDLIAKAITNLVDNAIRYSPERTTIVVSTLLEADAVRIVVEDKGYGIPPDSLEKVWEKFYRVMRDGQDKEEDSTGLGLSFVKEVIEQHGGAVAVESAINNGSKFSFTLPRL